MKGASVPTTGASSAIKYELQVSRATRAFGYVLAGMCPWSVIDSRPSSDATTQQVFVVVHRRFPDFDGKNLAGWLYRIAAHQVRDLRRLRWISHILRRSVPLPSWVPSPGPTALSILETKEKHMVLERLLATLNQAQRAAFVMFEIDGYTAEEIAHTQQVSINTVRARIHRARKKLTALWLKWRKSSGEVPNPATLDGSANDVRSDARVPGV